MPKASERSIIIEFVIENALNQINSLEDMDEDEGNEVDGILDEMHEDLLEILSHRRGFDQFVPKSVSWRDTTLSTIDESRYRQLLRVSRYQFDTVLGLIVNDDCFRGLNSQLQFPVEVQLSVVLYRLGSSGEGASLAKIASLFGIGDGGTIDKITNRVFGALLRLVPQYLKWPGPEERAEILNETYEELPHCIGYIDGTEIKLAEQPIHNHEQYFSRKHIYSVKLQVVVDHRLRIRDAFVGSPGSFHDAKMFRNSNVFINKENLFTGLEWIAGDSAYPLSKSILTPYRKNAQFMDQRRRVLFNKRHSQYRVRVEHSIGILKEKFSSLKELRLRLKDRSNRQFCSEWIMVCCLLHNLLLEDSDILDMATTCNIDINTADALGDDANAESKREALYHLMFD